MKKITVLFLILLLFTGLFTVSADPVDIAIAGLGKDFSLFFDGLGTDVTPSLLQNSVAGQNIGLSELGDSRFYFNILPVISFTAGNSLLSNRDSTSYYQIINLDATIADLIPAEGDFLLDTLTPIPSFKLNAGVKLPKDLELLVTGFWVPGFLMSSLESVLPAELSGVEFSSVNIGGILRYPLLKDGKGSPGLSIGAGVFYDSLKAGIPLAGLLGDLPGITLDDKAKLSFETSVIAFGSELTVSKKLLFFAPYAKLGAWYGISSLSGQAVLKDPDAPITGGKSVNDFALIGGTGFDLLLGPFCINIAGNYNLGSGIWGASIGSRLQF